MYTVNVGAGILLGAHVSYVFIISNHDDTRLAGRQTARRVCVRFCDPFERQTRRLSAWERRNEARYTVHSASSLTISPSMRSHSNAYYSTSWARQTCIRISHKNG
jgi:hypothetical protein